MVLLPFSEKSLQLFCLPGLYDLYCEIDSFLDEELYIRFALFANMNYGLHFIPPSNKTGGGMISYLPPVYFVLIVLFRMPIPEKRISPL